MPPCHCRMEIGWATRGGAGEGFEGWSAMPYLTALSLQNANAVTDAGCAAIARIAPLRTLNLKNCPAMSDLGLAALRPLKRLSHLRLQVAAAPALTLP